MSDGEYEKFEITDYDLEHEFNPSRKKLSKNQQIYGVWADNESDDGEDTRPSFSSGRKAKNYTAPIGFIAGGVQQAGKPKEEKEEKKEGSDEDSNSQGFGLRSYRGGSSSSDDGSSLPKRFGKTIKEAPVESEIAGLRKKGYKPPSTALSQRGVGAWEKHTKGIGAKLLLQMGYQPGKGLGKDLQGIEAPIEAKLRKGRGAVGAYGPEVHQKVMDKAEDRRTKKESGSEGQVSKWKKQDKTGNKSKYVVKTVEEVLLKGEVPGRRREFSELSKVKVIDMTGPEQRVLSGYHAISGVQKPSDHWENRKEKQNFDLPELLHNLDLLVDMCEQEIITADKTVKYNEDRMIALESELNKLEKLTEDEGKVADALEHLTDTLEHLINSNKTMPVEDITLAFQRIKESYPNEFFLYELGSAAPDIIKEPMQSKLSSWKPLEEPDMPLNLFKQWKTLLEVDVGRVPPTPMHDPYYRIMWDTWMPVIRPLVLLWDCKGDYDKMVELIGLWKPLLPMFIYDNLMEQLILPKLKQYVDDWNPLTDTIPIHTWTQPWIPYIGESLGISIFPVIRQKLGNALIAWYPSDSSARFMLMPWLGVFPQHEMQQFLVAHIVPKLAVVIQEMNVQEAKSDGWDWVISWLPLFGENLMAELLDKSLFPRWLQALTLWLNMSPNYEQISNWYSAWKALFPDQLRDHPTIKGHLRNALELMSRSVGGSVVTPPPPPPPDISSHSRYQGMVEAVRTANQMVEGFKDLITKRCEERGVVFMPLPNRYREAKQIYRCGPVQIYLDRNVIFCLDNNTNMWQPISLPVLMDKASSL